MAEAGSFFSLFFQRSPITANAPASPRSPSMPRTFFTPKQEETLPQYQPEFDQSTGNPLHIYDISDQTKLFTLHRQIIQEVNQIFSTHNHPIIPYDFLEKFQYEVHDKVPIPKGWFSRLFSSVGGKGKVAPNNDTTVAKHNLSVRKSCEMSSVPIRELQSYYRIPTLIYSCAARVRYDASKNGIFRISGNSKRITALTSIFTTPPDFGLSYKIEPEIYNTYDVADTMKKYFKSLEEPIFTLHLNAYFLATTEIPESARIRCTQLLMMLLPKENSILIAFLLELLHDIGMYEKENQMPVSNLAIVFAPTLMRAATVNQTLLDQNRSAKFLTMLIQNYSSFQLEQYSITGLLQPLAIRLSVKALPLRRKSAMKSKESMNNLSNSQELNTADQQVRASSGGLHKSVNFGGSMIVGYGAPPVKDDEETSTPAENPKSILERFHI